MSKNRGEARSFWEQKDKESQNKQSQSTSKPLPKISVKGPSRNPPIPERTQRPPIPDRNQKPTGNSNNNDKESQKYCYNLIWLCAISNCFYY